MTAIHAERRLLWFSVAGLVEAIAADCAKADALARSAAPAKRPCTTCAKGLSIFKQAFGRP